MRQYALIHRAILDDPSWRCLTRSQQNLYLLLLLKLSTNLCGVVDWRPKKLAVNASDMTVETIEADAVVLEKKLYIVRDEDTDEVLIRSFLRNDAPLKSSKTAIAVRSSYTDTASSKLRGVIVFELQRLYKEQRDWQGWDQVRDLLDLPSIDPRRIVSGGEEAVSDALKRYQESSFSPLRDTSFDTPSDGISQGVSDTPSDGASQGVSDTQSDSYSPLIPNTLYLIPNSSIRAKNEKSADESASEPENENASFEASQSSSRVEETSPIQKKPSAVSSKKRKVPKKEKKPATRQTVLAPDWKPSPELRIATAKAGVNLIREVTLFVAYYTQEKPEHRSANWDATYRRWLERDIQNLKMGRDPNNIALHPENLPTNGRLPKSMLNDMHNAEVQARAAAWDEAHPREEEFDEL
ncbi:hypothetical protein L0O74_08655 [Bifidobacterium longum]|uniref:hypothetical protein n=1 Tax=Bifidobacterium longum TaxID=216816 RepID=UPI001EDA6332|nr:hypothetical protein [Bifidobacterium longum]MCG4600963.1 hypothetical protein [Bifidobacterium longum]MCG4606435.1 hypothetical protein [Bifidobacterium longum]MCG4620462.1 hypothetical protein [Bifidobacterium longum]MCG4645544.1 hypothetical protein [Bifidobacterium longum]MCG4647622.1 hypothetical protein [Bifidobacterium longum]